MARRAALSALTLALAVPVACSGGGTRDAAVLDDPPPGVVTSVLAHNQTGGQPVSPARAPDPERIEVDTPTADEPTAMGGADPETLDEGPRFVTIAGAEVWLRTEVDPLPRRASVVEFTGPLIDEGAGPMACLGGVDESLPPQCAGPRILGLDLGEDGRADVERSGEVRWAERTVVITWPPDDDGTVDLVEERPLRTPAPGDYPPPTERTLPAECADIIRWASGETLGQWAAANPDRAGVTFSLGPERTGLEVVGDVDAIRTELTAVADGADPCLVDVEYSRARLDAAQQRLWASDGPGAHWITSTGWGTADNRLFVQVAVADVATVEAIASLLDDDPAMVRITGSTVILDGQ